MTLCKYTELRRFGQTSMATLTVRYLTLFTGTGKRQ